MATMARKMLCGMVVALALGSAGAWADSDDEGPPSNWRAFLVGGLTKGGDALDTVGFIEGTQFLGYQHVYAGNFLQVGVGALWTSDRWPLAVGLSINYHNDDATGKDGSSVFKRYPFEAIGYLLSEDRKWRVGLGARYVMGARLETDFPDSTVCKKGYMKFDETLSPVAEVGWALTKSVWANFRVVKETYKPTSLDCDSTFFDLTGKVDGSHIGANILYAF